MPIEEHIQKALRYLSTQQRRAFLSFALFLFFGCTTSRPALPQLPPITSAAELLQISSARYDTLRDQDMRATIDLTLDGVRERRTSALIRHKNPSDLKMVLGGLGINVMYARSQNDTLHVYLPRENNYLVGHPDHVLFTLTGVDLSYYAVDHAILGMPNLSPLDATRVIRFEPSADTILLELRHRLYLRRLWFTSQTGLLREEKVYDPDGQLISWRRLLDYHNENGFALPRHIEIHQGQDIILINVKSRKINTGLTNKDFGLLIPKDATRHDIRY